VCPLYLFYESFDSKIARKKLQYCTVPAKKCPPAKQPPKSFSDKTSDNAEETQAIVKGGNQPKKKRSATLIESDCRNVDSMVLSIGLQYGLFLLAQLLDLEIRP
jgi:hypothetical protein